MEGLIRPLGAADREIFIRLYTDMYAEMESMGMPLRFNPAEVPNLVEGFLKSKFVTSLGLEMRDDHMTAGSIRGFAIGSQIRLPGKYQPPGGATPWIGFIDDVYLVPDLRSAGWGAGLVRDLERELKKRGVCYIELRVLTSNPAGHQFWRKMGYQDYVNLMYKPLS